MNKKEMEEKGISYMDRVPVMERGKQKIDDNGNPVFENVLVLNKKTEQINGKYVVCTGVEIEYPANSGKKEIVKLKRLSWVKKTELDTSCMETKVMYGKEPQMVLNQREYSKRALLSSVILAPFSLNDIEAYEDISPEDGDKLFLAFVKLHEQSPIDSK